MGRDFVSFVAVAPSRWECLLVVSSGVCLMTRFNTMGVSTDIHCLCCPTLRYIDHQLHRLVWSHFPFLPMFNRRDRVSIYQDGFPVGRPGVADLIGLSQYFARFVEFAVHRCAIKGVLHRMDCKTWLSKMALPSSRTAYPDTGAPAGVANYRTFIFIHGTCHNKSNI